MYAVFQALLDKYHVKVSDVAKATGINPSKFSDWKHGRSSPKADKLKLIADYFGVTTDYLMTGEENEEVYYLNDDARDLAQFLFENPDYKILFDASRKVKREDLLLVKELIDRFAK